MKLKYYSFSKRKNSTKQPTGGTEIDVVLKEPCSMLSPVFKTFTDVKAATYVYVSEWDRYYFVDDITYDGPEYILACSSDPMATFKSAIGGTYADVEYTSSSTNTDITDPRNRPTHVTDEVTNTLFSLNAQNKPVFKSGASYVVGLLTDSGIDYYHCDKSGLSWLLDALFSADFVQHVKNDFYDMKNCLVSCIAIPIEFGTLDTTTVTPTICGRQISSDGITPVSLRRIDTRVYQVSPGNKALTFPSDGWGLDFSYLDMAPYTTGNLFLPYVGVVALDVDVFALNKAINIDVMYDVCTGDIVYRLMRTDGDVISTYQGNFAANVPVAGQSYNAIGAAGSMISAIGGVAGAIAGLATENPAITAGAIAGAASSIANSAVSAVTSLQMHTQINGSVSSIASWYLGHSVIYSIISRRPTELSIDTAFKAVSGMPYFKGDTISNLSGYVKCNGASIAISGFDSERETINAYLNGGFYYE